MKIAGLDIDADEVIDQYSADQWCGRTDSTYVLVPLADYREMAAKASACDDVVRSLKDAGI